jgi:hypothetical protein
MSNFLGPRLLAETEAADLQSQNWKGTSTNGSDTKLFMGGEFVSSKTERWIDVNDPVRFFHYIHLLYMGVLSKQGLFEHSLRRLF